MKTKLIFPIIASSMLLVGCGNAQPSAPTYKVTVDSSVAHVKVEGTLAGLASGSVASLKVTALDNYKLDLNEFEVYEDTTEKTVVSTEWTEATSTLTFTMPANNVVFVPALYARSQITITNPENIGTIDPDKLMANATDTVSLTLTAKAGWNVNGVSGTYAEGETAKSLDLTWLSPVVSFVMPSAPVSLTLAYSEIITLSNLVPSGVTGLNSVTFKDSNGSQVVTTGTVGGKVTVFPTLEEGYLLKSMSYNNEVVEKMFGLYTITLVSGASLSFDVVAAKSISLGATSEGVTLTGAANTQKIGDVIYGEVGASVTVTLTATTGVVDESSLVFTGVSAGDVQTAADGNKLNLVFNMPNEAVTVTAKNKEVTQEFTLSATGDTEYISKITIDGASFTLGGKVQAGKTVRVYADDFDEDYDESVRVKYGSGTYDYKDITSCGGYMEFTMPANDLTLVITLRD